MTTLTLAEYLAGTPIPADALGPYRLTAADWEDPDVDLTRAALDKERTAEHFTRLCGCVRDHTPVPLQVHWHHVWPLGMGGPDRAWNRLTLCPTAHASCHVILTAIVRTGGTLDPHLVRHSSRYIRGVAWTGWHRYLASLPEGTPLTSGRLGLGLPSDPAAVPLAVG